MSAPLALALERPNDYEAWRTTARQLLLDRVAPERVSFVQAGGTGDLFGGAGRQKDQYANAVRDTCSAPIRVPRRFPKLARQVLCHRDAGRHALLYRMLWRLQSSPRLLENEADEDVWTAKRLAQAVRRDAHKMKAFVRFRRVEANPGEAFIAWFEPEHEIVELTAPFFAERFAGMRWSIVTPERSAHWDGSVLTFGNGARRQDCPDGDALEAHWRIYYASIFNPARLKVDAMRAEMPKKYWHNLPESRLIPELTRNAQKAQRAAPAGTAPSIATARRLVENQPGQQRSSVTQNGSLSDVRVALTRCTRCDLCRHATAAVPGEGPEEAELMIVGEQPGDQEDLAGRPFVGPAGQVLDEALREAGIDREGAYLTNAVKAFKHTPRGKRRIHQRPNVSEIEHCRWWLNIERELVSPRVTVALGATAARAVLGKPVGVNKVRGHPMNDANGNTVIVTIHPAYLLRLPAVEAAARERHFIDDLKLARRLLAGAR